MVEAPTHPTDGTGHTLVRLVLMLLAQRPAEACWASPVRVCVALTKNRRARSSGSSGRGSSTVRRLQVDSQGELVDGWPRSFFDESFEERFGV